MVSVSSFVYKVNLSTYSFYLCVRLQRFCKRWGLSIDNGTKAKGRGNKLVRINRRIALHPDVVKLWGFMLEIYIKRQRLKIAEHYGKPEESVTQEVINLNVDHNVFFLISF